jgi:hypothetical protein
MARTLAERVDAAKSPRARLADNEALLEDLKTEIIRLTEARDRAAGESIDFALGDEDRDEAAAKASRYERTIKALQVEIDNLAAANERRREGDSAKAREAEKAAIIAERDELAAQFKALVEPAVAAMLDLFPKIQANAERLATVGMRGLDAEVIARGVAPFRGVAGDAESFLKMKIPNFSGTGRAWPVERRPIVQFDIGAAKRQHAEAEERRRTASRKAAEEHARLYGRYHLSTNLVSEPVRLPAEIVDRTPNLWNAIADWQDWQGELAHADAEELRKVPHLIVTSLDRPAPAKAPVETLTMPARSEPFAC